MKFKPWFLLFLTPFFLHLFSLFFFHFDETFHPKSFHHGFDKTYSTRVCGLDFSLLNSILEQPFHYLSHGKQMIAFESSDGRYVLKFFNPMRPLKKSWYTKIKYWKRYSSLKWISREWFQKKTRFKKLFFRHKIAFETLREETGLVFVHLAFSEQISHFVSLVDNNGKKHILSLSETPFVLQEKAILVPQYLSLQSPEKGKEAVASLKQLLTKRAEVGITDRIQTMENNYGFVGSKPIQIDIGRIRYEAQNSEEELSRILGNFSQWVHTHFSELE